MQAEVKEFLETVNYIQTQAENAFSLRRYNQQMAAIDELLESNRKNSFEYQMAKHLEKEIADFESDRRQKGPYIDLHGRQYAQAWEAPYFRQEEKIMGREIPEPRFTDYRPLDLYVEEWMLRSKSRLLVILGEYGTGKTTFSRHICSKLAAYCLDNTQARTPLFLPLRNFEKTLEGFISEQCTNRYGLTSLNFPEFERRSNNGELLVVLDGFDEMTQRTDSDEKRQNFLKIRRLVERSTNSKFILTCREEYFQHSGDFQDTFGQDTDTEFIHLMAFDEEQIMQFLRSHNEDPDTLWRQIDKTFDLKDLAKRPVLLELIVKYLPRHLKDLKPGERIKASDLYSNCIEDELSRVEEKIKAIVPGQHRLGILRRLAAWMYVNDTLSFDTREIGDKLRLHEAFSSLKSWEYEKRLSEFLTFTFLLREDDYRFRISHKSFRDYLAATVFVEEVNQNALLYFPKTKATEEVRSFMLEHPLNQTNLLQLVLNAKHLPENRLWQGTNAANLLLRLDRDALEGKSLSECVLKEVDFWGCSFKNTSLHGAVLSGSLFSESILEAESQGMADCQDGVVYIYDAELKSLSGIEKLSGIKELSCDSNQIRDLSPIARLTNIQRLDCPSNQISDLSPIAGIANLQELSCDSNQIRDLSPIAGLTNIQRIECPYNQISDLSPIAGIANLQELSCDSNQIRDLSPIAGLVKLQTLSFGSNQISNLLPIARLVKLQRLNFSSNQISNLSPIAGLINLQNLNFSSNQISNLSPITGLINLQNLNFSSNQISNLSPIAGLINLQNLNFSSNQISNLSPIAGLVNLQKIECSSNQISDLSPIAGLGKLQYLNFNSNQISNLSPIAGLENLQTLSVGSNQISDLSPLANLANLTLLYIGSNPISDLSPLYSLKKMRYIFLHKGAFPEKALEALQKELPGLRIELLQVSTPATN